LLTDLAARNEQAAREGGGFGEEPGDGSGRNAIEYTHVGFAAGAQGGDDLQDASPSRSATATRTSFMAVAA
jgi:hypothetical protein